MNAASEKLLSDLHPLLQQKVRQMAEMLEQEGIQIVVVQGLRTCEEQDALYQQGRTKPGKIVTDAPAGHSYHNYALACDCAPENPEGSLDWNVDHPEWKRMEEVGTSSWSGFWC
jgi:peptidoglycan L-alanyl-D-glutamate endopeptidase CwlK